MGRLSNSELLQLLSRAARDGQDAEQAWEALDQEFGGRVRSFLRAILGDRGWAEEVTQDVFVAVYIALRKGTRINSGAYIWRIAANKARTELQRPRARFESCYQQVPDQPSSRQPHDDQYNDRQRLEAAIRTLPECQREAFLLHDHQGLSYDEIAEITGKSPEGARSNVCLAREKLRGMLGGDL